MDANAKRYLREFLSSMAAYAVMVPVSIWLLKGHEHSPARFLFAVLPVIPSVFAMWAAIRFFRGLDELQRRIQFEGVAFAFLATCLISLTWGFLQNAGLPHADVIWVTPLLISAWGLGLGIASRRYQ
ncbi:MAG TPA: hypothetical protein VFE61_05360 [Candidatus Sulfotelmatobacter sp.]|jgi:hypothetical protein|nr:hypothetical protein [Candidatus Sulfotelmatobacter sp.]